MSTVTIIWVAPRMLSNITSMLYMFMCCCFVCGSTSLRSSSVHNGWVTSLWLEKLSQTYFIELFFLSVQTDVYINGGYIGFDMTTWQSYVVIVVKS